MVWVTVVPKVREAGSVSNKNFTVIKCDAEHNLFLSIDTFRILKAIKECVVKIGND